jgi:hypothetical protein
MSNFIKVRPVGAQLFHADRRTDGHDEAYSRFSEFCKPPENATEPLRKGMNKELLTTPCDIYVGSIFVTCSGGKRQKVCLSTP